MGKLGELRKYIGPAILACIAEGNQLSGATIPWLSEALFLVAGLLALFYLGSHVWERYQTRPIPVGNGAPPAVVEVKQPAGPPPPASSYQDDKGRIFVGKAVTPTYLTDFFNGHTAIQARKLYEPFLGKWMPASGPILQVADEPFGGGVYVFTSKLDGSASVGMSFNAEWRDRIEILALKETITVIGKIRDVDMFSVKLVDCELVNV